MDSYFIYVGVNIQKNHMKINIEYILFYLSVNMSFFFFNDNVNELLHYM